LAVANLDDKLKLIGHTAVKVVLINPKIINPKANYGTSETGG
jgi:hypothetical protein